MVLPRWVYGCTPLICNGLHASVKSDSKLEEIVSEDLIECECCDRLHALIRLLVKRKVPIGVDVVLPMQNRINT